MGGATLNCGGVYCGAKHPRYGVGTQDHGQCHWHGACLDSAQFVGMGLIARTSRYDYRIACHIAFGILLQTICIAHVGGYDQAPTTSYVEYPISQKTQKKITHNL